MKKSLILSMACLMGISAMAQVQLREDEVTAVKFVQGQTTDWYMLADNPEVTFTDHNPVISGKTYDLANGEVETTFGVPVAPIDEWVTVRTDGAANNWNTICLEHNITAIDGATFWNVVGQDDSQFILEQVTEPEAGQGYLIRFTKSELKVKYGDQVAAEPVTAINGNPIQGTFEQIDFDEQGKNVLVGNYVVYNNQLCPVEGWVGLLAHRAYVKADLVPNNAPAPVAGRARAYMSKPKETPTELEPIDGSQCTMHNGKFLRKGQLIIVKDGKRYNALGF